MGGSSVATKSLRPVAGREWGRTSVDWVGRRRCRWGNTCPVLWPERIRESVDVIVLRLIQGHRTAFVLLTLALCEIRELESQPRTSKLRQRTHIADDVKKSSQTWLYAHEFVRVVRVETAMQDKTHMRNALAKHHDDLFDNFRHHKTREPALTAAEDSTPPSTQVRSRRRVRRAGCLRAPQQPPRPPRNTRMARHATVLHWDEHSRI